MNGIVIVGFRDGGDVGHNYFEEVAFKLSCKGGISVRQLRWKEECEQKC